MKISKRTQQKFADFATDNGVLRTIRDVFEAEDFEEPDNFKSSPMTGERRTLVTSFHSLINFNDEAQQRRLLRVYLHAIDDWGRGFIDGELTDDAKALIRSLRRGRGADR